MDQTDLEDVRLAAAVDQAWQRLTEPEWDGRLEAFVHGGLEGLFEHCKAQGSDNPGRSVEINLEFIVALVRNEVFLRRHVADRYDAAAEMRELLGDDGEG